MDEYLLQHRNELDKEKERERLALLEEVFDPPTIGYMKALGVSEGWQCLEVGAGAGSMTRWLSRRVGPGGNVLALDVDTSFLERLEAPNVQVRRQDVVTEALPESAFDLVYARLVLFHLPERDRALDRMIPPPGSPAR